MTSPPATRDFFSLREQEEEASDHLANGMGIVRPRSLYSDHTINRGKLKSYHFLVILLLLKENLNVADQPTTQIMEEVCLQGPGLQWTQQSWVEARRVVVNLPNADPLTQFFMLW